MDLAVPVYGLGGNRVAIFLGNGDGTFQAADHFPVGEEPTAIGLRDLDEDGNIDLVVSYPGSPEVTVLTDYRTGAFGSMVNYPAGGASYMAISPIHEHLAILDLNGDGTFKAPELYA